jgi:uncharacterized protein YkwD
VCASAVLLALTVTVANPLSLNASAPSDCQFMLGFKTLHDLDPADVGNCTGNQVWHANGDASQPTTRGMLVWRKSDNFTAFTNGTNSWVLGPFGLQKRLNLERFAWELPNWNGAAGRNPAATSASHNDMVIDLFNLVNGDRQSNGEPPLVLNSELSALAQKRAEGLMASHAPLSHYDPNGNLVLRDMMTNIPFVAAGENLADNNYALWQTVPIANQGLMNSPTHRANILRASYNQMGVGVAGPDPGGQFYYVQLFIQTS